MNRRCMALAAACALLAGAALAADKKVVVNPILVAKSDGSARAAFAAYEVYADKIWDQANIMIDFLAPTYLDDTAYWAFDYSNAWSLVTDPGHGQSGDALTINAFFVDHIYNASVYGFAYYDQPYMVLDVQNILGYSALGRVDTFSHELGHNLYLPHYDVANPGDPNAADHLMASGGIRNIPQDLGDVAPDGNGWDLLGADEIDTARASRFAQAVPEPATLAVLGAGLAILSRRRRK
ncbi:MAG: PEP-CTERM sorting domain-containing protein [Armatimonadetes bacterium]|nr:PEP-CTERM sorting domain-containing protein [Armatimonadota bacterium]NOG38156.1 PEP-CTERM sorting domain-containing protein [Armatimonadota bacterium]WKZ80718.1 MAG: PEP-CTERM sorting domain-containing protein [Fimbriimonadaceae bacterium]GIK32847.1 MAG: hypothetical protein BroJett009_18390 [Armatimonadota bacterium]